MARRLRAGLAVVGCCALLTGGVTVLGNREADRRRAEIASTHSLANTRHGVIEYVTWGTGPPVLVLHGAGGGFDQGRLLAEALGPEGAHFIAVSRFGYLNSGSPSDPSTAAQAQALVDLLDRLKIARVDVLAMSGGVPPALKFATMFPRRTDRMVLLSSAPFTPFRSDLANRPIPTWAYSALLGNDALYWVLTKTAPDQLRNAFDARPELLVGLPPEETAFVDRLVDGFFPAADRRVGLANEGAAVDPDAAYHLEGIRAPTLVVHARDDRLNPFAVGERLAQHIPDARFIALDRGGHLLLDHHARLRDEIGNFFDESKVSYRTAPPLSGASPR